MATWPPDLPSQTGRTALVTGANTGVGLVTARELARAGARVHLACRNKDKADAAMATIRQEVPGADLAFLPLDLGSLASVRAAAETFLATGEPLHLLINNAGLVGVGETTDGFELTFGVNHIGPFLLTTLLLDRVKESAPARIVTVASAAHRRASGLDFEQVRGATRSKTGFDRYAESKLANVLFSAELAHRLDGSGVLAASLHPGVVASDIWRRVPNPFRWLASLFMLNVDDGARTSLHCATAPDLESGAYYDKQRVRKTTALGADRELGRSLWAATEQWVGGRQP